MLLVFFILFSLFFFYFFLSHSLFFFFFFFNDTATTEIYTLSLHDALPICREEHTGAETSIRRSRFHGSASRGSRSRRNWEDDGPATPTRPTKVRRVSSTLPSPGVTGRGASRSSALPFLASSTRRSAASENSSTSSSPGSTTRTFRRVRTRPASPPTTRSSWRSDETRCATRS